MLPPLFDDLQTGVLLHDPDTGDIRWVNERGAEILGHPKATLESVHIEDIAPLSSRLDDDPIGRIRAAAAGESRSFERRVEQESGEIRWVRVHLGRTTVADNPYVYAELSDVTEHRRRERRLCLLSRVVRHNLRNRMNVIMGYAERVRSAVDGALESEVVSIVENAAKVGSLSESVRQLEEIAAPSTTERTPTDLRAAVRGVVEDAAEEHTDADLSLDAPASVWVVADEGLDYALQHAVQNAIEHNDRPSPTVSITVSATDESGVVRIADDGPPIPDEEIDVLAQDAEVSDTYHGSGVGLWVIQWCVDSLGGDLSFAVNEPRGNVVSITLPSTERPPTE